MKPVQIDETKLLFLYLDEERTIEECARILTTSQSVVYRRLKKLKVETRPRDGGLIRDITDDQVVDLYWGKELSISETARQLNRSEGFVRKRLHKSGKGMRTVTKGARLWRKSDEITNEQLIYLHDTLDWSCRKISSHFNKSEEFVRQRFMVIGKPRRKNTGCYNGSWKGGVTDIRNAIRSGTASSQWRNDAFARQRYRSEISGEQIRELNCHHIYPFHVILKSSITQHSPLPDEYRNLAIINDARFYDQSNGLVVSKEEHDKIEFGKLEYSNPWWKIWRPYPDFATEKSGLSDCDFELFDEEGQIGSSGYTIKVSEAKDVRQTIRYEHYLGTIPRSKLILTAKRGSITIGVATFGVGTNKHISPDTWELTRLCIPFYVIKPFACEFLNECCEFVKNHYPQIKRIIAFADSSVGHNGGIYRMAGWRKAGKTQSSYAYFDPTTFRLRHKAACRRIKGVDKTERELAQERGWIRVPLDHKYRYTLEL